MAAGYGLSVGGKAGSRNPRGRGCFLCGRPTVVPLFPGSMGNPGEFSFLHDDTLAERLVRAGVRLEDCVERFVLGGGPGGQKINKTASTVHLVHAPSGVEVRMQRERSQIRNRQLAWTELADRLDAKRSAAAAAVRDERELERRRTRQRSRAQKARMLVGKKHRAKRKAGRKRGWDE